MRMGLDEEAIVNITQHLAEEHSHRLRHEDEPLNERAIEVYGVFDFVPLEVLLFTEAMEPEYFQQLQAQGVTTWGAFGRFKQLE